MRALLSFTFFFALLVGCNAAADSRIRCAECGMYVDIAPRWNAGLTTRGGEVKKMDTPICMLRFLRSARGQGARDAWVTEYYSQRRIAADAAWFVAGTDLTGPMGRDLVPCGSQEAAERMKRDHHGAAIYRLALVPASALQRGGH